MTILVCIPNCLQSGGDWAQWAVGPAYVSAALKAAGHRVIGVNFILEERSVKEALSEIMLNNEVDIVATGDLVTRWEHVKEITDTAKSINPDVITIIGGGLVTHSPIEAMEIIPSADYGVIGEGEITECELVAALERGEDGSKVPGVVSKKWNGGGGAPRFHRRVKIYPIWTQFRFRIMTSFDLENFLQTDARLLLRAALVPSPVHTVHTPAEKRFVCARLTACLKKLICSCRNTV